MHVFVALNFLLVVASTATFAFAQGARSNSPSPAQSAEVVLANSHSFVLRDPKSQVDYRIYVALPQGYAGGTKTYPVLYLLDADNAFALATQAYRLLRVDSATPDLLLVGIGYDLAGAARRARRDRDLTPTRLATDPDSGEAAAFLTFIADTVIPTVDARYRVAPNDRAIFGHSIGGLFALYALFDRPDVFRRYIVSSPSLWWDGAIILQHERRFSQNRAALSKSVFMSVGSEEPADMLEFFKPFADALKSRGYASLQFETAVLPGETHLTAFSAAFLRGLRVVYR